MNEKKILIIVPTLNEGLSIGNVISKLNKHFSKPDILVIDAYSSDETVNEVKKSNANIIQIDRIFGLSAQIETGILYAFINNYDFLIRVDGDCQHEPSDARKLLNFAIQEKSDLMIGSRFLGKSEYRPNILRLFGIKLLRKLIDIFYSTEVTDCNSGCQILSKRFIKKLSNDENFEYSEISIICKAIEHNMSIKEKFIDMKNRKTGHSKFNFVNSFKFMFKNLLDLLTSIKYKK